MLVYPKVVGAFEKLSKKYLGSTTSTSFWKDAPPSELKQRWIHALGSYVENKLNLSSPSKPSQSWSGLTEEQKVECVLQFINKEVFVELGYKSTVNNLLNNRQTFKFECTEYPRSCYYTLRKYFVTVNTDGKLVNYYVVSYSHEENKES